MKTITVNLGEPGDHFLQRNQLKAEDALDKQPAGLNFYEYTWSTRAPGRVVLELGKHNFEIPFALGITGTEDAAQLESGITDVQIRAGITAEDKIAHDEARREMQKLLQRLTSLGWRPFIYYENPRMVGKESFLIYQEGDLYGLPVNYDFSLQEWMEIDVGRWQLYASDVFLNITFRRDKKLMDPSSHGAYIIMYDIQTATEFGKSMFEGDERDQWQNLWIDKIKALKKERYAKEAELTKRGFTIYSEYEEPKIHPADPVEP